MLIAIRYRRKGKLHTGDEIKIELFLKNILESKFLKHYSHFSHLYEEVAYQIYEIRTTSNIGLGMIGN
jgi:hypothetical protein